MIADAQVVGDPRRVAASLHVVFVEGHVKDARGLKIAVPRVFAELPHIGQANVGESLCLLPAEMADCQRVRVVDTGGDDSGVSAAGAIAGDALFEHDDVQVGFEKFEEMRRPEPGKAGPDDGNVALDIAGKWVSVQVRGVGPRRHQTVDCAEPVASLLYRFHARNFITAGCGIIMFFRDLKRAPAILLPDMEQKTCRKICSQQRTNLGKFSTLSPKKLWRRTSVSASLMNPSNIGAITSMPAFCNTASR